MTLHSLPLFVRLAGRPVILLGDGEAADAKRRLLERAGAVVVGEEGPLSAPLPQAGAAIPSAPLPLAGGAGGGHPPQVPSPAALPHPNPPLKGREPGSAALAIVAIEDEADALAAVARLKSRGILVNAVDRPALCDFTLPAIVDRAPVIVAIGTGGVSAGLAAALRQRLEALLPADLGRLADALHAARDALRARFPDGGARRRAIGAALAPGGPLDPLGDAAKDDPIAAMAGDALPRAVRIALRSADPDDLTLREARWLAAADRVVHDGRVPPAILDRARADAARLTSPPAADTPGLSVYLETR